MLDIIRAKRADLLDKRDNLADLVNETEGAIAVLDELLQEAERLAEHEAWNLKHNWREIDTVIADIRREGIQFVDDDVPHPSGIPNKLAEHMAALDTAPATSGMDKIKGNGHLGNAAPSIVPPAPHQMVPLVRDEPEREMQRAMPPSDLFPRPDAVA